MLERLPEAYTSLYVTIDTEWTHYTQVDLQGNIYNILRFLKVDPLKIFYATITLNLGQSNNRLRVLSSISTLQLNLVYLAKKLHHYMEKCWQFHPETSTNNNSMNKNMTLKI